MQVGATAAVDLGSVIGCAGILWHSGGSTVVDGSWMSQLLCLALGSGLLIARRRIGASPRAERVVFAIEATMLVSLISAWALTGLYLVGWIAAYGALSLLLASLWNLLALLVVRGRTGNDGDPLASVRAVSIGAALIAVIVLTPIHGWSASILGGLVVLISGTVLLSFALRTWTEALVRSW